MKFSAQILSCFLFTSRCLIAVLGVAVVARAQSSGNAAAPSDKTAEEVYANIKALNGVPYGEVIPGMQVMSEALGVDCEFCHSQSGDRDVEGNPNKDVAREMIRMVRDLNQRNFGGRHVISCYTCHRGSVRPENLPDLGTRKIIVEPATTGLPSVQQVLDKYVAALGGSDAIQRNSSRVEEGELSLRGGGNSAIPFRSVSQAPDKRLTKGFSVSHLGNSSEAWGVVNGAQGWMRESNGPVRVMFGWRRDAAQLEDLLNLPKRANRIIRDLRVRGRNRVDVREAYILSGHTEFLPLVELFFDVQSGLLVRIEYFVDTAAGRMPSRIDYSDYREADGIKVPFHWDVTLVRGVRVAYQLTSVKQNVPVEAAQFALPDPPPKLYR